MNNHVEDFALVIHAERSVALVDKREPVNLVGGKARSMRRTGLTKHEFIGSLAKLDFAVHS